MSANLRTFAVALVCAFGASCSSSPGAGSPGAARPAAPEFADEAVERGRLLTSTACAGCHATGTTGDSPMAEAPPLREIAHRYPLDRLEGAFAEGLVTSHPAMPAHVFRASEIDDLIAYLDSLRTDP